jgi:hypothetical protein
MKTIIILCALTTGCAHLQGRETVRGIDDARWCQRQAVTYVFGEGLASSEIEAFRESASVWNAAVASYEAGMVSANRASPPEAQKHPQDLFAPSATPDGNVEISRHGGDWGTKLALTEDGCIAHAHIEVGPELDPQVLARETAHELGHALGLAESTWPGDVMYNGDVITRDDVMVATQRFQATTNDR